MKKSILIIAILMLVAVATSYSQVYVEGKNINELDVNYLQLGDAKGIVFINYGQEIKQRRKDARITDSNGKELKFNSLTDALNFTYKNGWKFVSYNDVLVSPEKIIHVFTLEKK